MTENEAINELQANIDLPFGFTVSDEVSDMAIQALKEIQQYRAIGTVEEFQKAKMQYDDIHSVAEKTALIGLSDYGTAKEAVITEIKRNLDYSLKEYQSIGTVEEFKDLKEKSVAKKPIIKPWSDARCPSCNCSLSESLGDGYYKHFTSLGRCGKCNQKLDWE